MTNYTSYQHSIVYYNLYYISFSGFILILCFIRFKNIVNNLIDNILYNNDIPYNNDISYNNNVSYNNDISYNHDISNYDISNDEENNFDNKNNYFDYDDSPPCYNDLFKIKN